MKKITRLNFCLLFGLVLMLFVSGNEAKAATITSVASGNWSATATWPTTNRSGNITTTSGSPTVNGSGTSFLSDVSIGTVISTQGGLAIGTVASITSNTILTLNANASNVVTGKTWRTNGAPGPGDAINIASGINITVDGNYTCASMTFNTSTDDENVYISGTYTLTINGALYINQPTSASFGFSINYLHVDNGTVTVNGLITFAGTIENVTLQEMIYIVNGTLNANGGITFSPFFFNKIIDMQNGAGTLNLKGAFTGGAYATVYGGHSGSIFNYLDNTAQTIGFFNTTSTASHYCNLYINNTSTDGAILSAAVTTSNLAGDIKVQTGKFRNGGYDINGTSGKTFGVSNGAVFEMTGPAAFPTGFSTFAFDPTSTVRYLQTNAQTIYPCTYGHLEIKPSTNSITHTFGAGTTTVAGNLTIGNGTNTGVGITAATNASTLNIAGNFTIAANTTFTANTANALSVGGDWTNNGTFTHNSGTVNLNGSSLQTIKGNSSTTFNNLTCDNPTGVTLTNTLTTALGNTLIKRGTFTVPPE